MSFFGYDTSLPRDRQNKAPGFGPTPDAFAGFAQDNADDGDALDFEETYDGLGDELDEADDALNDDTFGAAAVTETRDNAARDFSFGVQPSQPKPFVPNQPPLQQQPARQQQAPQAQYIPQQQQFRQQPQPQPQQRPVQASAPSKPTRTGYERYKEPDFIPNLEASASIWGPPPPTRSTPTQPAHTSMPSVGAASKKMMSLEEVEAAIRAQKKPSPQPPIQPSQPPLVPQQQQTPPVQQPQYTQAPQILQRPQQHSEQLPYRATTQLPAPSSPFQFDEPSPQILQRPQSGQFNQPSPQEIQREPSVETVTQPRQILQNPARAVRQEQATQPPIPQPVQAPQPTNVATMHARGPSHGRPVVTHPEQILQMSDAERAAFLEEDAKRAKRNHKIYLLSKDNGLMTPQDKNFITRIQLQQLVTATGNVDEGGPEAALAEDFYFQVFSQIRGAPKQNQNNHFAQTYLYQTGGRGNRRYPRGGDSHMRRMEQQVQRAVEAVKQKPKNKQLVIEGSLGKISFSNAKTPKPLLNLKRPESSDVSKARSADSMVGEKAALRNIEELYNILMKMEDHERKMPPQPKEESSADEIQEHMDWRQRVQALNSELWQSLKVLEPIDPNSSSPHPFIAIISHSKGKKLMPRVFRQIDDQQRLTVLTMIIFYLDQLDVIRSAIPHDGAPLPKGVREQVDIFTNAVMPSLFAYVQDADLAILLGLMGLILDRVRIPLVVHTKTGIEILTMFISRAHIIKNANQAQDADWQNWTNLYNRLFDILEPHLGSIFPGAINSGEDVYVWRFLAAMGIGAGQEQQQRLVIAVKDRVMETVQYAKSLPEEQGKPLLGNVNLFMQAIGLDVELLG